MREKFFEVGNYRLRLDDIRIKPANPHNRIHINCSMLLTSEGVIHAPTRVRRLWELLGNPDMETAHVEITSQLKGIDIEVFPIPPDYDPDARLKLYPKVPMLVCLQSCILRDLELHRRANAKAVPGAKPEIRLYFSVGIEFDTKVWAWGGKQVFCDCFAKFSQSQTELFDDHPADLAIRKPQDATPEEIESLARELGTAPPEPAPAPAIDPLRFDQTQEKPRGRPAVIKGRAAPVIVPGESNA